MHVCMIRMCVYVCVCVCVSVVKFVRSTSYSGVCHMKENLTERESARARERERESARARQNESERVRWRERV